MMNSIKPAPTASQNTGAVQQKPAVKTAIIKSALFSMAVLILSGICVAKDVPNAKSLPDAPSAIAATAEPDGFIAEPIASRPALSVAEKKPIDVTFVSLALISTASTFSDSYTTLFARENWLAGKKGVCNEEVESAYLYGTHPTVGRAYAVASAKSATSIFAAYYLRKHHSKFWSLPLVANSVISLQGVTQNMIECN
jgi:hypothetical protein